MMWGYAEGNPTLVGVVVAIIVLAAIAYVVQRLLGARRASTKPGSSDRRSTSGRGR